MADKTTAHSVIRTITPVVKDTDMEKELSDKVILGDSGYREGKRSDGRIQHRERNG